MGVFGPHTTLWGMEWGIWTSYYPLRDRMGVFGPHTTLWGMEWGYLDLILPSEGWNGVFGPHTTLWEMEWGICTSYYPLNVGAYGNNCRRCTRFLKFTIFYCNLSFIFAIRNRNNKIWVFITVIKIFTICIKQKGLNLFISKSSSTRLWKILQTKKCISRICIV